MPKVKSTKSNLLQKYVSGHNGVFKSDGKVLYCNVCNKAVNFETKFLVEQHLNSQKHQAFSDRATEKASQSLLTNNSEDKTSKFTMELCDAFISADIPLWKLTNPQLKSFLEKYTNQIIPVESTVRKNYVDNLYTVRLSEIVETLKSNFLWVSIDETTDAEGRFVANVIVGVLDADEIKSKQKFLLNIVELDKVNHASIARAFVDSITLLGPNFDKNKILLYLTDAAPYMVKSANVLNVFYPKMLHVTCLAHAMHRVAEEIRNQFENIDLIISYGKKIFLKAPSRVSLYKEKYPELKLPPQPIVTRWGTWLEAVGYYAEHFDEFKDVMDDLNEADAVPIQKVKDILNLPNIKNQIVYVYTNYGFLVDTIAQLEGFHSLNTQVELIDDALKKIKAVKGNLSEKIKVKMEKVLEKNHGFKQIKEISTTFCLSSSEEIEVETEYSTKELASFKYAPITSVEVERSFSMYKSFLRPNRQNFAFEHLKKNLFIHINKTLN